MTFTTKSLDHLLTKMNLHKAGTPIQYVAALINNSPFQRLLGIYTSMSITSFEVQWRSKSKNQYSSSGRRLFILTNTHTLFVITVCCILCYKRIQNIKNAYAKISISRKSIIYSCGICVQLHPDPFELIDCFHI